MNPVPVRFESDWLGTQPCFYNEKTGVSSACIHDVIDYRNLDFDADGLIDYLDFGFCAFGRTPVRHVRFVPPCTRLVADAQGRLREESLPDPVDSWVGRTTQPHEAMDRLRQEINQWERSVAGEIILPLSGGLDSRLLAHFVHEKSRLRAFTYGVSARQENSREVTRARLVAQRLGISWENIRLGDYHTRIEDWEAMFGISTHAHGMYHLEFYEEVVARTGFGRPLLSGLVGDAWAGSIKPIPANSLSDLPALGLTRGQHAATQPCRLRGDGRYREVFWESHRARLQDPVFQIVEVIRQKMTLLAFALIVPGRFGFSPWCPFLLPEVALSMVTLPPVLRVQRRWQKEFFAHHGLNVERPAGGSRENNLDLHALRQRPPQPLDIGLLRELFEDDYLTRVNRHVFSPSFATRALALAQGHPLGQKAAALLRLGNAHQSAYAAYLTLKPLEYLLRRRNSA
ncbi:MAG: hypothetical protein RIQ93_363 [Verrucomicrobiota bacterium]